MKVFFNDIRPYPSVAYSVSPPSELKSVDVMFFRAGILFTTVLPETLFLRSMIQLPASEWQVSRLPSGCDEIYDMSSEIMSQFPVLYSATRSKPLLIWYPFIPFDGTESHITLLLSITVAFATIGASVPSTWISEPSLRSKRYRPYMSSAR